MEAGGKALDPEATPWFGNVPEKWVHIKLLVMVAVFELPIVS